MSHNAEQKIKLLVLYDILCQNTDEAHPLNTMILLLCLRKKESRLLVKY